MYILNIISHITGFLARIRIPSVLNQALIKWYVATYKVNLEEIAHPLSSFPTLSDFFVRDVKPRTIQNPPVYPVDGTLRGCGLIREGMLEQVKGVTYSLGELIGDSDLSAAFGNGVYFNMYLSPKDYHHVHMPVSGEIKNVVHIPGTLFPVNNWSILRIPRLFCKNERLVFHIASDFGEILLIMVGALNVGSMKYTEKKSLEAGERLGTFQLGSSVVLCMKNKIDIDHIQCPRLIKFGESIA